MSQLSIRHSSVLFVTGSTFLRVCFCSKTQPVGRYVYGVLTYRLRVHDTWEIRCLMLVVFIFNDRGSMCFFSSVSLGSEVIVVSKSMDIFFFFSLFLSYPNSKHCAGGVALPLARSQKRTTVCSAYQADQ